MGSEVLLKPMNAKEKDMLRELCSDFKVLQVKLYGENGFEGDIPEMKKVLKAATENKNDIKQASKAEQARRFLMAGGPLWQWYLVVRGLDNRLAEHPVVVVENGESALLGFPDELIHNIATSASVKLRGARCDRERHGVRPTRVGRSPLVGHGDA